MSTCFYCEQGEKLNSLMIPVCDLSYAKVYLNRDQKHPGRCILQLNDHKTEYFQMSEAERIGFASDISILSQAIYEVYQPQKLNYATFGDLVPHLHIHMVPKYEGQLNWGGPFDDTLEKVLLSQDEYDAAVNAIREKIAQLQNS